MREYSSKPTGDERENLLAGVTFTLDGETFECRGSLRSTFRLQEMARRSNAGDEAAMLAATPESFLLMLGPEEYKRLTEHIFAHETPDEVLAQIGADLDEIARQRTEAQAARPTRPPKGSGPGPTDPAERMSRVISLQTGDVQVMPQPQDHKPKTQPKTRRSTARKATA